MSRAFASADIFAMPSESETLGFVVLEALASGIPAVAVSAGGIPGIVKHNVTGLLSPATGGNDASEFCDNILRLANNLTLREEMGKAARIYAETLNWRSATEKLRRVHYPTAIKLKNTKINRRIFSTRNFTEEKLILQRMKVEEDNFNLIDSFSRN